MKYVDLKLPSGTLWSDCNVGAQFLYEHGIHLNFKKAQQYGILPTKEQIVELVEYTTHTMRRIHGNKGILFTGKNGNKIFMPFAGYRCSDDGGLDGVGEFGLWWSCSSGDFTAYSLYLDDYGDVNSSSLSSLRYNISIRLVKNK